MSLSDLFRPNTLKTTDYLEKKGKIFRFCSDDNLSVVSSDIVIENGRLRLTSAGISLLRPSRNTLRPGSNFFECRLRRTSSYQCTDVKYSRPPKKFITGSRYAGEWNDLGFCGEGTYRFPHGVLYDGHFNRNGEFHGVGQMIYPNGQRVKGMWRNGRMLQDATFIVSCGEVWDELHKYCVSPDRRFYIEIEQGLNPAGMEYLTNSPFPKKLPPGTYDVGDGVFYPDNQRIMVEVTNPLYGLDLDLSYGRYTPESSRRIREIKRSFKAQDSDLKEIKKLHTPSLVTEGETCREVPCWLKEDWIIKNCRKAEDEPVGYIPQFYQTWTAGRKQEVHNLVESDHSVIHDFLIPEKDMQQHASKSAPVPFVSFIRKPCYDKWKSQFVRSNRKILENQQPKILDFN